MVLLPRCLFKFYLNLDSINFLFFNMSFIFRMVYHVLLLFSFHCLIKFRDPDNEFFNYIFSTRFDVLSNRNSLCRDECEIRIKLDFQLL